MFDTTNIGTICHYLLCLLCCSYTLQSVSGTGAFCPVTTPFGDVIYITDIPSAVMSGITLTECASKCNFFATLTLDVPLTQCRCFNYNRTSGNCSLFAKEPTRYSVNYDGETSAYEISESPIIGLFQSVKTSSCGLPFEYNNHIYNNCLFINYTSCCVPSGSGCYLPNGQPAYCTRESANASANSPIKTAPYPMISSKNCSFPFTFRGQLYYSCMQNVTNVTTSDYQFACLVANYSLAVCYPPAGARVSYGVVMVNTSSISGNSQQQPLMSIANWIVIMSRVTPAFPTNQTWDVYANGFGDIQSDFWFGLWPMHHLTYMPTNGGQTYRLRFELQSATNHLWFSEEYDYFFIDNQKNKFALYVSTSGVGDAGDGLNAQDDPHPSASNVNGRPFASADNDTSTLCAQRLGGGWWYNKCSCGSLLGAPNVTSSGFRWVNLYYRGLVPDIYGVLSASRMMVKANS